MGRLWGIRAVERAKIKTRLTKQQSRIILGTFTWIAGWSSLVARRAHNPKVAGSNPAPATTAAESVERVARSRRFFDPWRKRKPGGVAQLVRAAES